MVAPAPRPAIRGGLYDRAKDLVVHRILVIDDTPHRIAWGVFWGFVVGASPTIGFQMLIYLVVATVVRANKISGILPIWLSNPITAIPLYYFNWRVGAVLLGAEESAEDALAVVRAALERGETGWMSRLASPEFWSATLDLLVAMGAELWVGSLLVGVIAGALGYWATYRGVIAFRRGPA